MWAARAAELCEAVEVGPERGPAVVMLGGGCSSARKGGEDDAEALRRGLRRLFFCLFFECRKHVGERKRSGGVG